MDGDIRYVRIRGMSQNLNTVTINGNRAANAASAARRASTSSSIRMPMTIERMEVSSRLRLTWMAIRLARVNLVTKSAFDSSPERRISGSIGSIWRPWDPRDTDWPKPRSYSLNYSEVFNDKLGVAVNLGYRVVPSILSESMQSYQNLPNGTDGPAYTYSFDWRDSRITRTRGARTSSSTTSSMTRSDSTSTARSTSATKTRPSTAKPGRPTSRSPASMRTATSPARAASSQATRKPSRPSVRSRPARSSCFPST